MEYLYVISHIPLYTGHFILTLWPFITHLPWPSWDQYFGTLVLFTVLYKPRQLLEQRIFKAKYGRRKRKNPAPTATDHQTASAVIGEMIHHF